MELTTSIFEQKIDSSKYKGIFSDPADFKRQLLKMQESLLTPSINDSNLGDRFSGSHLGKYNPFAYDMKKGEAAVIDHPMCRIHILQHKLLRIHKEFRFIKRNIKSYEKLTPREKEIIQLIATGNNNPNIAEHLFISRYTVEQHRKNINYKLKIKSLPHLMQYMYAFNLV